MPRSVSGRGSTLREASAVVSGVILFLIYRGFGERRESVAKECGLFKAVLANWSAGFCRRGFGSRPLDWLPAAMRVLLDTSALPFDRASRSRPRNRCCLVLLPCWRHYPCREHTAQLRKLGGCGWLHLSIFPSLPAASVRINWANRISLKTKIGWAPLAPAATSETAAKLAHDRSSATDAARARLNHS